MIWKNIDELKGMMTEEQKRNSEENFKKFYLEPFGEQEAIIPLIEKSFKTNGEEYLKEVDLSYFD